tara:strand:+ start:107 stop:574 length:468 start_codon:yes stop_codon:yes gene_type:complete
MSKLSRYRKSKPSDRKVVKKGTVTQTKRFTNKPSVEAQLKNKVVIKKLPKRFQLPEKLNCFEDWDLNQDGILDDSDVSLFFSYGLNEEAQILSGMIINKRFPKYCKGDKSINTLRSEKINKQVLVRDTAKQHKVRRTFKNLKKLKNKNRARRNEL